jgi:hypothetical protein
MDALTMQHRFPKTKLTRGSISGPTLIAVALLLQVIASHLLAKWFFFGLPMNGVWGLLLTILAFPFAMRALPYFTGDCVMIFCDDKVVTIKESSWRRHYAMEGDIKRIVRDGLGYTIYLNNGRHFRMLHKDAGPQHSKAIGAWHTRMENAIDSATDAPETPAA